MANEIKNSLIQSLQQSSSQTDKKKPNEIGKDEFLKMLVTQLKNQDPLDPMDGSQFAVNLAQFSQLEQLISINGKLGGETGGADINSLAGYLGNGVLLDTDKIHVESGDAGALQVQLPADASDVMVDLVDDLGNTVETLSLGELPAGKHIVALPPTAAGTGEYKFEVREQTTAGAVIKVGAVVAGVVSGFVPGPDPVLLVGGREVSPSEIKEVHALTDR